jgi:copper homeostasis protein
MEHKRSLEVCAFNIQSCIAAEKAGAVRVELCVDPLQGGTTPSYGLIQQARERLSIKVYPIIRPREGDFFYDDAEFAIMKRDIDMCKEIGCDGISIGTLTEHGEVDVEKMKRIVEWAYPMKVTFHRVFDATNDIFKALEDLIGCGCERILTAGQKASAVEATDLLTKLVAAAGDRIIVMPGGGVRSSNIKQLLATNAKEFHTSGRMKPQIPTVDGKGFDIGKFYIADEHELRSIVSHL